MGHIMSADLLCRCETCELLVHHCTSSFGWMSQRTHDLMIATRCLVYATRNLPQCVWSVGKQESVPANLSKQCYVGHIMSTGHAVPLYHYEPCQPCELSLLGLPGG